MTSTGQDSHLDLPVPELLAACRSGQPDAWTALVHRYKPLILSVARSHRLSRLDCEEVLQQTWLRVYQNLHTLHHPDRFRSWLVTCARRESLRQYARAGRYVPIGGGETFERPTEEDAGPEGTLLSRERRAEVVTALHKLSDRDRTLLGLLSSDADPSYSEVSRRMGISRGSVGPLRARALRRLAAALDEWHADVAVG